MSAQLYWKEREGDWEVGIGIVQDNGKWWYSSQKSLKITDLIAHMHCKDLIVEFLFIKSQ